MPSTVGTCKWNSTSTYEVSNDYALMCTKVYFSICNTDFGVLKAHESRFVSISLSVTLIFKQSSYCWYIKQKEPRNQVLTGAKMSLHIRRRTCM